VIYVCCHFGTMVLIPTSNTRLFSRNTCRISNKCVQKTFCFDKSKCQSIDEINQNTPVSSASQFKEPRLKKKVIFENETTSANFYQRASFKTYLETIRSNPSDLPTNSEPRMLVESEHGRCAITKRQTQDCEIDPCYTAHELRKCMKHAKKFSFF